MTVGTRVQLRNDTAANWTSANPTLLAGEAGIETDTGKFKLGNGSSAWTALSYAGGGGASTPLTTTVVKTSAYTAAANERVPVDTTSGAVTVTLPTAPADGTQVEVGHIIQGGTNAVTIARGGSSDVFNKAGGSTSVSLPLVNQKMYFTYISSLGVWWVRDALSLATLDARYIATGNAAVLTNATPQTATTGAGAAGTASEAMRADAVIPLPSGLGANQWWGDGSDGTIVLDGTFTPPSSGLNLAGAISKSGSVYTLTLPCYFDQLTVTSGVTLIAKAPIYCKTSLTVNSGGVIHNDGASATGSASAGSFTDGTYWPRTNSAAAGSTGVGSAAGGVGFPQGGGGGAGGSGGSGAGGTQATASGTWWPNALGRNPLRGAPMAFSLATVIAATGTPAAGVPSGGLAGASGAGDGTNSGGGGGLGGGILLINAKSIVNNGVIRANGGGGGTPSTGNCGGGGAGGGGILVVNSTSASGSGTYTANPGTPGSGVGTGAAGAVCTLPTTAPGTGVVQRNTW